MIFWLCVLAIVGYRIYIDVRRDPSRLPIVKRIVAGVIVALLLGAALSADDAQTNVIVRCQMWWCWPW